MRYRIVAAAAAAFVLASPAMAAQSLDCAAPIAAAEKALGKVTGDLSGTNKTMAKSETKDVHKLIARAKRLLGRAQQGCGSSQNAYDQAEAIGEARAAHGYATAAEVLHAHYAENPGSGGAKEKKGKKKGGEKSD